MIRCFGAVLVVAVLYAAPIAAGWDEGVAAFRASDHEEAVRSFEKLVENEPRAWRGHYLLGLSLDALARKAESLVELKQAGLILAELSATTVEPELFDAESGRQAAELVGPGPHWQPLAYLGMSLAVEGNYDDAILELQKASRKALRPAAQKLIWQQLAGCFEQLERWAEAGAAYRKAHDPRNAARVEARINAM